jgi:uncharacterized protein YbjQ (UPF0145 family)
MIVTTTNTLQNHQVVDYLGIVTGEAIQGAHIGRDILAGFRDVFGGRSGAYETTLREAREEALREMIQAARSRGADAVIGVDIDYEVLGKAGGMLMVTAAGTAVKLAAGAP